MGAGASNISRTDLDVLQSAVTDVGQDIKAEAKNINVSTANTNQTITFSIGDGDLPENPCILRTQMKNVCLAENCETLDQPYIYQTGIINTGEIASPETCEVAFGLEGYSSSDIDNICNGNNIFGFTNEQRFEICQNHLIKNYCPTLPKGNEFTTIVGTSCVGDIDCPVNTECNNGVCGYRSPSGYEDSTCNGITQGTVFLLQEKNGDKIVFKDYTGTESELRNQGYSTCSSFGRFDQDKCYTSLKFDNYFYCDRLNNSGGPFVGKRGSEEYNKALVECEIYCDNAFACTEAELELYKPQDPSFTALGTVRLENIAETTLSSDQSAKADVTAEMTTFISNTFQNEVLKEITQKNKGINFNQENSSVERTTATQKVKNIISQTITDESKNTNVQNVDNKQEIKFTLNRGSFLAVPYVEDGELDEECDNIITEAKNTGKDVTENTKCYRSTGSKDALVLSNQSFTDITNEQEATSTVDALMNSSVFNDLSNKYTFKLKQTNEGLDLVGLLTSLFMFIIIGALVIGGITIAILGKLLRYFLYIMLALTIIGGIACIIVGARGGFDHAFTPKMEPDQDPSGIVTEAPQPPNPDEPLEGEKTCTVADSAGCVCNIYVTSDSTESTTVFCSPFDSFNTIQGKSRNEQCTELVIDNGIRFNPLLSEEENMELCMYDDCSARSYVGEAARLVCSGSNSAGTLPPTVAP